MRRNKRSNHWALKLFRVLLPILLILFWFGASLILSDKVSFTVLQYPKSLNVFKDFGSGSLLKGHVQSLEFKADQNFLGIVNLRVGDFIEDYQHDETLSFRIKEKGSKNWYFTNSYKVGYFSSKSPFPFGFPLINDSKGRNYDVEVESSSTNPKNFIKISKTEPVVITSYQYPKQEIASSAKTLIYFMIQKISTSFSNTDFIRGSFLFALPLFFYLLWLILKRFYDHTSSNLIFTFLLIIYFTGLFVTSFSFLITFAIIIAWFLILRRFKINDNLTFYMGILLVFVWIVAQYLGATDHLDNLNIWSYIFISLGVLVELVKNFNEKI